MTSALGRLWKNEYFKTTIMIIVIVAVVFGFWFGLQTALGTEYPALAVASGSMCLPQHMACDGWSHPFERTLHKGDLIIVQGVRPEDVYAAPFNESGRSGDIIVFRRGMDGELIVHRAMAKQLTGGKWFFTTKGDANSSQDPEQVSQDDVIGRVVLRIPWVGHLALFMRNSSAIYIILAIIILLVIVEFVIPSLRTRKIETEPAENVESAPQT